MQHHNWTNSEKSVRGIGAMPWAILFALSLLLPSSGVRAQADRHPLSIEDVLTITAIDQVSLSPDGRWAAIALQRPVSDREVFGRTSYEADPGRADIWLVSMQTLARTNLTNGGPAGGGFWCPAWSPDGTRLAMLSTRPEGGEPHGGDNVRLYVWALGTGAPRRVTDRAILTQTRYGSPLYQVNLQHSGPNGTRTAQCGDEENAPFVWLNGHDLLAVTLPTGAISGLLDEYSRASRQTAERAATLRAGREPTMTAITTGAGSGSKPSLRANLERIAADTGRSVLIGTVPAYPFRGGLTISLSPNCRRAAILATTGSIAPPPGGPPPSQDELWLAQKRLGFVDLRSGPVRWVGDYPAAAHYPLELFSWSPDGDRIALRARDRADTRHTTLFVASASKSSLAAAGPAWASIGGVGETAGSPPMFWVDRYRILARLASAGSAADARADWWLLAETAAPRNVTARVPIPPATLERGTGTAFFALGPAGFVRLNLGRAALDALIRTSPGENATIVWRSPPGEPSNRLLLQGGADGRRISLYRLHETGARVWTRDLGVSGRVVAFDAAADRALVDARTPSGERLFAVSARSDQNPVLLDTNRHLAEVAWGKRMLVDYVVNGRSATAGVILPPDYQPGRRYPVITWVYPGYQVRSLNSYLFDHYLPGIYNLQLYSAQGYVVLIPAMSAFAPAGRAGLQAMTGEVLAAIDALIARGIADGSRLGLIGQSFGGFGVYSLVTQTKRFQAAVAVAGDTSFEGLYGEFDRGARGYPGIDHEKSDNWVIAELGQVALGKPPFADPAAYHLSSPLTYVNGVTTPLLMIHGELDKRAPMTQSEQFFFSLYRQGKPARLLRYWGEDHAISLSPANVRSVFDETMAWFAKYLHATAPPPVHGAGTGTGTAQTR